MNWLDNISRDELPDNYQELFDVISMVCHQDSALAVVLKLSAHYSKQPFYFKSLQELITARKKKYIVQNFKGDNHAELARATEYSLQTVYEVLAEDRSRKQGKLFL